MSPSFCVLPWIHLATHPNGGVSLCCRSNHAQAISWARVPETGDLMTLEKHNLLDIANSDTFKLVRKEMLSGNRPVHCEGCWQDEAAGIESKRQYENKRWADIIPFLDTDPELKDLQYRYIELRLGNTCNSSCVTCNSFSSSKWYKDEKYLSEKLTWFELRKQENFKWFENIDFYKNLAKHSRHAEEIYINGGEPTLIKQHYEFLSRLIRTKQSKNIHLVYSLNMMEIPDVFLELLTHFKKVTINASIDDLEERNYYIRYPTQWSSVLLSLEKLRKISVIEWNVTQTVSVLNIDGLDKFYNFFREKYNKIPIHNYVLYPNYLSLGALPPEYKEDLKIYYKGKLPEGQYIDLLGKLDIAYNATDHKKLQEFLPELDISRKLSYIHYLPHLKRLLCQN